MLLLTTNGLHVVFIGDSVLRYTYLALAYQVQSNATEIPITLLNEKKSSSWMEFYNTSTNLFEGMMSCDCFRESGTKLDDIRENRYYHNTKMGLRLTYIEKFGDFPANGLNMSKVTTHARMHSIADDWSYNWNELLSILIPEMDLQGDAVDAVVMNAGFHFHSKLHASIKNVLEAGIANVPVLIWVETTPIWDRTTGLKSLRESRMYELTRKIFMKKKRPQLPPTDNEVCCMCDRLRSSECNKETYSGSSKKKNLNCIFCPFPYDRLGLKIVGDSYWDDKHFQDGRVYQKRNLVLFETMYKAGLKLPSGLIELLSR